MRKLFSLLKDMLQSGQDAVLVSVVASLGSAPRGAGGTYAGCKRRAYQRDGRRRRGRA